MPRNPPVVLWPLLCNSKEVAGVLPQDNLAIYLISIVRPRVLLPRLSNSSQSEVWDCQQSLLRQENILFTGCLNICLK